MTEALVEQQNRPLASRESSAKDIYPPGRIPQPYHIPHRMYAQVIREDRFGDPSGAFRIEEVAVPSIGRDECLVLVMAAGINYNGIWASRGAPINVVRLHQKHNDGGLFHIGGSDGSGIVYAVGEDVQDVRIGDEVVMHGGAWDVSCPHIKAGGDPMFSPSFKIWGYETNYGSFAQFTRVKASQILPKPAHLSWEEAAAYMGNAAAAYRALHGFPEHAIKPGQLALIWGGAGGIGSQAIQICKAAGAVPIAVVSSESKAEFCLSLGAKGVVDRTKFDHWGVLPHWDDTAAYKKWLAGARAFGEAIWAAVGAKRNPQIVFEHPGEATLPTSCFVCDIGGMVVICAGTTGYNATLDLRHHWMRQKRFQGTHFANGEQAWATNELVRRRQLDPCLSRTFSFEELPLAHQLMSEAKHPHGNMAVLISAKEPGLGRRC
jgi:crotonyl-CoA carboxylase/reductase